nr:MAG TPA: hypothetical protein [Caudoviricetes sp.]
MGCYVDNYYSTSFFYSAIFYRFAIIFISYFLCGILWVFMGFLNF